MNQTSRKRPILINLGLFALVVVLCERLVNLTQPILAELAVGIDFRRTREIYESQKDSIRQKFGHRFLVVFDPDLGWRYRNSIRSTGCNKNLLGMRGRTDSPTRSSSHSVRVAAFGDSFVYGSEVDAHESWPCQLESLETGIEMLNFAVGGYGTDQAYLMYDKYGKQSNPHIILIGFTAVQVARNVNVYRRFLSTKEIMFVKPRFVLSPDGNIELLRSPIQLEAEYWKYYEQPELITELGTHDYWYTPLIYRNPLYDYSMTVRIFSQLLTVLDRKILTRKRIVENGRLNSKSEAFEITTKILRLFYEKVRESGSVPIIILFPDADALGLEGGGRIAVYEGVVEYLRNERLEFLDLAVAFREPVTRDIHFMSGGHYSGYANGLVAKEIAAYLRGRGLIGAKVADDH